MTLKRTILLMCLVSCLLCINALATNPADVAQQFCRLELDGITLNGDSSEKAWALTVGEEEPFMAGEEVASDCKVISTKMISKSEATATIQFQVLGKLVEDSSGARRLLKGRTLPTARILLERSDGEWKILKKSLMNQPVRVKPAAWARHFQRLIEPEPTKRTELDRKLSNLVDELKTM